MKRFSTIKNGDDFRFLRHLGRKPNNRDEDNHGGKQVTVIHDEVEVVAKHNLTDRRLIIDELRQPF